MSRAIVWLRRRPFETWVTLLLVAGSVVFIWLTLYPSLLLADTTTNGGDLGAHVWGPAFLRDHLLPHWRLSGWTPDWYAGFPAYQFYMVVPSLFVVALHAGIRNLLAVPVALGVIAVAVSGWFSAALYRFRRPLLIVGLITWGTWGLLRQATHILLEGTPPQVDVTLMEQEIAAVPGVTAVHDLHVWTITSGLDAMSAHILVRDGSEGLQVLRDVRTLVKERFGIDHVTVQVEDEQVRDAEAKLHV